MGNRLYVGNLSFHSDTEAVRAAFTQYGEVTDVHIVTDRATGQSRGWIAIRIRTSTRKSRDSAPMRPATVRPSSRYGCTVRLTD